MDNNKNIYVTDGQDLAEKVEELVESGVTDVTVNVNTSGCQSARGIQ